MEHTLELTNNKNQQLLTISCDTDADGGEMVTIDAHVAFNNSDNIEDVIGKLRMAAAEMERKLEEIDADVYPCYSGV